ncbi:MAG: hypothetical protein ACI8YQ_003583, partial [Polaribacter sp.]
VKRRVRGKLTANCQLPKAGNSSRTQLKLLLFYSTQIKISK